MKDIFLADNLHMNAKAMLSGKNTGAFAG